MRGFRVAIVMCFFGLACVQRREAAVATKTAAPESTAPATPAQEGPADVDGEVAPPSEGLDHQSKLAEEDEAHPASLEELTASLDRLEVELRGEGVRLQTYRKGVATKKAHPPRTNAGKTPASRPPNTTSPAKDADPCWRICTIATTVCELRTKICVLADAHADEPRYAAACKRAERDCTRATEACNDCR